MKLDIHAIESLDLDCRMMTSASMAFINKATRLRRLHLRMMSVSDQWLREIDTQMPIQSLNLGGTQVTDHFVAAVRSFKDLRALSVERTRVTGRGLYEASSIPTLTEMYVTQSQVMELTPQMRVEMHERCPALKIIVVE